MNDISRVRLRTTQALFIDEYRNKKETGSLILIDDIMNETLLGAIVIH